MGTKMKGLLKGLRYISQIFDNKEEEEMQIGYPTDVKHVAHIGWDGNSSSSPSWMNEYRPGSPNGGSGDAPVGLQQLAADGLADHQDSAAPAARQSRRSASSAGDAAGDHNVSGSPNREARSSGRHQSTSGTADSQGTQEHPSESSRHVRRHRSNAGSVVAGDGGEPASTDAAKQARRRRSSKAASSAAGGSGGEAKGSVRSSSRLKHQASARRSPEKTEE